MIRNNVVEKSLQNGSEKHKPKTSDQDAAIILQQSAASHTILKGVESW